MSPIFNSFPAAPVSNAEARDSETQFESAGQFEGMYIWSPGKVLACLSTDADTIRDYFPVTEHRAVAFFLGCMLYVQLHEKRAAVLLVYNASPMYKVGRTEDLLKIQALLMFCDEFLRIIFICADCGRRVLLMGLKAVGCCCCDILCDSLWFFCHCEPPFIQFILSVRVFVHF